MRILIGSNVHWWNAEAAYAATIAQLLKRAGHIVFVITCPGSSNEKNLKKLGLNLVTHVDLNTKNPFKLFFSYLKLKKFLIEERIELINAHLSEGFPLFVFAARNLRKLLNEKSIPIIRTRGTTRSIMNHWLNRKMHIEWTDYFITAGEVVKERLLKNVNISEYNLKTIYYPVVSPVLPFRPLRDYRHEFNIKIKSQIIAVVGRIRPIKGQRILLKSFCQLLLEFPDLVLLIIYRDTSENELEMKKLRNDISKFGIETNLRLIPEREHILQLMDFVDVGIVSSIESEVICRVAVEFFSVGTPVVAFHTGCLPEIIRDGVNGLLVKSQSHEELFRKLRIILKNPKLCKRFGNAARRDAEIRFDPQKMLNETLKVFNHFVSK